MAILIKYRAITKNQNTTPHRVRNECFSQILQLSFMAIIQNKPVILYIAGSALCKGFTMLNNHLRS